MVEKERHTKCAAKPISDLRCGAILMKTCLVQTLEALYHRRVVIDEAIKRLEKREAKDSGILSEPQLKNASIRIKRSKSARCRPIAMERLASHRCLQTGAVERKALE
jgi:hypothetical protein